MNKAILKIGIATLVGSLIAAGAGYRIEPGFWQNILVGLATTFFGIGLAVVSVNHFLSSSDKKQAAAPLLQIIRPNVQELHNKLLLEHFHDCLGKHQFETLLGIYWEHKGNPQAFSPEQRETMYQVIAKVKSEVVRVHDALQEQLKEVTLLLGWSFDTEITGAALDARLHYASFKTIHWDGSDEAKLLAIKSFLNAEAATSAVFGMLVSYLGLKDDEWLSDQKPN